MAFSWTDAQLDAINTRGRDVLVCAAAGSGKTATLTERIIRRLTDKEDPADISRMLIVTYTRNAAAELREKIYKALSKALEEDPSNKHLSLQMMKLPGARISTIHSFCFDIVKRNTAKLGLVASVTNEAAAESELRAKRVMGEVVSDFYDSSEYANDFAFLSECITGTKDERTLPDILLSLYRKLCSYSGGAKTLEDMADEYSAVWNSDFFETSYGMVSFKELCDALLGVQEKYRIAIDELYIENDEHPYLSALYSDQARIEGLLAMLEREDCSYSQICTALYNIEFEKLKSLRKEAETVASRNAKDLRNEWKKALKDKLLMMFEYTAEEISDTAKLMGALTGTLARVMRTFEQRFLADKREAGVLDYNDLEHYALKALYDGDEPSDAAREIALLTDEIYIDEYQDVNEVQDKIFTAVSNGHNLFMVGDVKQSIYSFRGGDPSIFISRRDSYAKLDREKASDAPCSIFMQNNFRCDKTVVDFANAVFATLLGETRGRFKYISEDALVYSKDGGVVSPNEIVPRVVICEGEENTSKKFDPEAFWVADEIVRLLTNGKKNDGESIRPDDIAILMRSDKAAASAIKAELERRGVPVTTGEKTSPYDNPEVQLIICMLNSIDNPHRDIYLAGVLLSELYGFSPDELVRVKSEFRDSISLYDSLKQYTEKYGFEKGRAFFESNDRYRELAKKMPSDKLIWQIFTESSFLRVACSKCNNVYERRLAKRNCMFVYDLARSFESGAYRGLYSFVEYLEDMMREKIKPEAEEETFGGCVRIMSMHASKGLEFPVCFVCDTQRSFNRMDLSQKLMFDADIGVGMKIRSEDGIAIVDNPFRRAISLYKERLLGEEEMRILYVALTRAREKLYITAKPYAYADYEKMTDKARYNSELFCVNTVSEQSNFIDAVLLAIAHGNIAVPCERAHVSEKAEPRMLLSVGDERSMDADCGKTSSFENVCSQLQNRFDFEYPYARTTRMKAKMSVSKLYPGVLDEDEASDMEKRAESGVHLTLKPQFLFGERSASAAERGTATHLIMQFADFEKMEKHGAEREIQRLVEEGFIDQRSAAIARIEDIKRFIESSFYQRIKRSDKLWREMRFNLRLDASIFSEDEDTKRELSGEELLVQGVIDGFFLEGERVILFDYKTDYLTERELADAEAARQKLSARHAEQLCYYKMALEKMFCRKVEDIYIYSLPLGREVSVDISETVLKRTGVLD